MSSTIVWHEPTFGLPCFERLLGGQAFVPTIIHIGRKIVSTALAILASDKPFVPAFENQAEAKAKLLKLQQQYKEQKGRKGARK